MKRRLLEKESDQSLSTVAHKVYEEQKTQPNCLKEKTIYNRLQLLKAEIDPSSLNLRKKHDPIPKEMKEEMLSALKQNSGELKMTTDMLLEKESFKKRYPTFQSLYSTLSTLKSKKGFSS